MPIEVKEKFNNSPEMYVNMMGTPEFNKIMGKYNKMVSNIEKAGSLKNYQEQTKAPEEGAKE